MTKRKEGSPTVKVYVALGILIALVVVLAGLNLYQYIIPAEATPTMVPTATIDWVELTPEPTVTLAPTFTPTSIYATAISEKGKRFIIALEGLHLEPYLDVGGKCTLGIGHLVTQEYCTQKMSITSNKAFEWFDEDLDKVSAFLRGEVGDSPMNQCQYDALTSFAFNVSNWTFRKSGVALSIRLGNYSEVPLQMKKFVYIDGGDPIMGLDVRRKAEARLFEECVYEYGEYDK